MVAQLAASQFRQFGLIGAIAIRGLLRVLLYSNIQLTVSDRPCWEASSPKCQFSIR